MRDQDRPAYALSIRPDYGYLGQVPDAAAPPTAAPPGAALPVPPTPVAPVVPAVPQADARAGSTQGAAIGAGVGAVVGGLCGLVAQSGPVAALLAVVGAAGGGFAGWKFIGTTNLCPDGTVAPGGDWTKCATQWPHLLTPDPQTGPVKPA